TPAPARASTSGAMRITAADAARCVVPARPARVPGASAPTTRRSAATPASTSRPIRATAAPAGTSVRSTRAAPPATAADPERLPLPGGTRYRAGGPAPGVGSGMSPHQKRLLALVVGFAAALRLWCFIGYARGDDPIYAIISKRL